ncbi:MAG: hypothetical protein GF417_03445, partial [Candidatus Latescibacteria bacterium]|nr:hypothetical protein [bacterium]MBD3423483.1 hypothetical protein [Candidatus Latescibacterota bacterium]
MKRIIVMILTASLLLLPGSDKLNGCSCLVGSASGFLIHSGITIPANTRGVPYFRGYGFARSSPMEGNPFVVRRLDGEGDWVDVEYTCEVI